MHITVICPSCRTRYHLESEMLGKSMRCTNAVCRVIFEVQEAAERLGDNGNGPKRDGTPSSIVRRTGSVGDIVPILESEPESSSSHEPLEQSWRDVPPIRKPDVRKKPSWQDAPPPVRRGDSSEREITGIRELQQPVPLSTINSPLPAAVKQDEPHAPVEMQSGDWAAPPVRSYRDMEAPPALEPPKRESAKRRRAPLMIAATILVVSAVSGGIVYWVWNAVAQSEAGRYRTAMEQFNDKQYVKAEGAFALLSSEFPESERASEYKFRHSLCQALRPAFDLGKDSSETFAQLQEFVRLNQNDPHFKPNTRPIGEAFDQISKTLAVDARQSASTTTDFTRGRQKLKEARKAGAIASQFGFTPNSSAVEEYAAVESAIAKAETRLSALDALKKLRANPADIEQAKQLIAKNGLESDPEAKALIERMKEAFRAQVTFVPANTSPASPPASRPSGLVIVSKPNSPVAPRSAANGVMFALARGILHALSHQDGEFLWAARVGIDTTALPVRVPANETLPELALITAADDSALSARDVSTGQLRWQQPLSAPCVGKPVLVGRRVYVPTNDGRVYEIEVDSGQLIGWFELGSPLTVGGVHEDGTDLVYVPANGACVYVLDVKQRKCVNVLQTGHPAGSLRCPPILARPDAVAGEAGQMNYLVLCQADGPWAARLRAFPLASSTSGSSESMEPEPTVRGWPWFEPSCDGEKIALATDAGTFGLFGINQPRNQDTVLFRMLPEDPRFADGRGRTEAARAQVVYARDRDFWVLIAGRLRHLQLAMDRNTGLKLLESWSHTALLGHPVQSGQVDEAGERLFLVTQPLEHDQYVATAVDTASGKILWQRRLGLNWRDGVLNFNGRMLALDRDSGLYEFDPSQPFNEHGELHAGGRLLAPPSPEHASGPTFLLESSDGKTACVVVGSNGGTSLEVWRYEPGHAPIVQNMRLSSPLHGTPALGADYLLLPLADGSLHRQPLDGKPGQSGTWRSTRADRNVTGHAIHLGPGEFLTTDGGRGISRWTWPPEAASPKEENTLPLANRMVGAPTLLPPGLPGSERFITVADSTGAIRLLKVSDLSTVRTWDIKGKITDGPYVQGTHLACIADGKRLIWIDPTQDGYWDYVSELHPIVGRPLIAKDVIVVADRGGRIVGIDPATGKPVAEHVSLGVSASPTIAPMPFGDDRLFVPMTDGTAILLPLAQLKKTE